MRVLVGFSSRAKNDMGISKRKYRFCRFYSYTKMIGLKDYSDFMVTEGD